MIFIRPPHLGHAHEHGVVQHRLVAEGFDFRPGDA
jgi:hypothetical protein